MYDYNVLLQWIPSFKVIIDEEDRFNTYVQVDDALIPSYT